VTAEAARTLALSCKARLVLVGRTPATDRPDGYETAADEVTLTRLLAETDPGSTPGSLRAQARALLAAREVRQNLASLHEAGVTVRYLCLDVTDGAALTEALAEVRRDWGPITGVIHGAGILADKLIADKTDQDFDEVFNTKVAGLRALLAATKDDPLRLLCAFSSVAAQFGNIGQCDYAMGNETLNQVLSAEAAHRPRCVVRALLWGPWDGGMVDDRLAGLYRQAGISLIDPAEGGRALLAEMSAGGLDTRILLAPPQTLEILARRRGPLAHPLTPR
jgi:NAD(P)-dependent dehydrogenase (short-subunit alcohol dehydrogenase family)